MIDRLGLVGLTFRHGGSEALARFTLPVDERAQRLAALALTVQAEELVYVATCNRVEVAIVGADGVDMVEYRRRVFAGLAGYEPQSGEAERALRAWAGEGAVEHLFLVAAGLDSAQVGEREIRGQLRDAVRLASSLEICGPLLEETFDEALRVAKRVHEDTAVGAGRTSLAAIALDHVRARLELGAGRVAVVGVSAMTRACAQALAAEGVPLLVVNRTAEPARELAGEVGGDACTLAQFRAEPPPLAAAVLATAAPEPVLDAAVLERLATHDEAHRPLLVDMAIPPDVDQATAWRLGLELVTMDEISRAAESNRERRHQEVAAARERIDSALVELRQRLSERWVTPVLASLSRRYRQTAVDGVERLLRRELQQLDDTQRVAIRRWAEALAKRFAHIPVRGLRALAVQSGSEAVEAFLAASDDSLARELRDGAGAVPESPAPDFER